MKYILVLLNLMFGALAYAENLVINGYGEEGSNAGFAGSVFDGTDFGIGNGSFVYSAAYKGAAAGEMIPLERGQIYRFSFYLKSKNPVTQAHAYAFLWQYDIDGFFLNAWNTEWIGGTNTELASNLNNGDTEIHLSDASGWIDHSAYYVRGIEFWDYENSHGYKYRINTYTRNYYARSSGGANTGLWSQGTGAISGNTISLTEPWSYGLKSVGTQVSQNNAGGHFYLMSNSAIPSEWTYYEFIVPASYFSGGTAFIRPGWLMNYPTPGSVTGLSGVRLEVIPQVPGIVSKDGLVGIGVDEPQSELDVAGRIRAQEIIVEASGADFVFEPEYQLRTLGEVASHIIEYGHLPDVPSATEMQTNGMSIGETQTLLLQKIEELTLYMIEKDKQVHALQSEVTELRAMLVDGK